MKTYFPLIFMGLTTVVWAGSPQLELSSPNAILRWNEMGLSVKSTADAPVVEGTPKPVWAIRLLENPANDDYQGKTVVVEDTQLQLQQKQLADGSWEVWYPRLSWDDQTVEISVKLTLRCVNGAFRIHAEVQNDTTRWVVAELIGPVMAGIKANLETHPLLWPAGMGKKVSLPPTKPYEIDERTWGASHWKKQGASYEMRDQYPSQNFTMQWIAFAGEEGGLYLASHDPTRESKQFAVHYFEDTDRYKATILHLPMIPAGGTWEKNLVEIYPYSGDWHVAARHYRQWVDSWNAVGKQKPSWVDKMAGMYLVILKQQNGRFTMWNYEDIGGQLCDYADEQGYDFLALFGWHHGGHDHLYPEYLPAEELGGREGLKKGIAAAKARGKRVYLYANGQLIDRDNQKFWEKEGESLTIRLKDGSLQHEIWKKFIDSPGHFCGRACSGSPRWFEIMRDLALQANELGADGILYDQLAVGASAPCFAPNHGHPVPAMGHGTQAAYLLEKLCQEMKEINPEFIILTEGMNDAAVNAVSYYHGVSHGIYATPSRENVLARMRRKKGNVCFQEMFRYTYPEVDITIRNPLPMEHPRFTNLACLYGLNHEVELRYPADVDCVKTGKKPTVEAYAANQITGLGGQKSQLQQFPHLEAKECFEYSRKMIAFQRDQEDLLLTGKFVDTEGFEYSGEVFAKGFVAGNRLGVVVWNPSTEAVSFEVKVPGGKWLQATAPGEEVVAEPFGKLAPESVRLLIWER